MADQSLKSQFFVVRPNNTMVPLIALDELPSHIVVRNVPRMLSPHEIQGMISIGTYPSRHLYHSIVDKSKILMPAAPGVNPTEAKEPLAINAGLAESQQGVLPAPATPSINAGNAEVKIQNQHTTPRDPAVVAAAEAAGVPVLPVKGKKIYCTHWMRTGECDFTAGGCKFSHIMPFDLETLDSHGFGDIPKWFRDKHGLGSHHAVKGSGASFDGNSYKSRAASGKQERNDKHNRNWRAPQHRNHSPSSANEAHQTATRGPRSGRRPVPETRTALHRSKHAPVNVSTPVVADTSSAVPSSSNEPAANAAVQHAGVSSARRGRRQHIAATSECSDYEAEVLRGDAERKAKEDAEYAAIKSASDPTSA